MCDALETTEEECLTHHVEVVAQGVHQVHQVLGLIGLIAVIVGCTSERVVEYLIESATHQLLGYYLLQAV